MARSGSFFPQLQGILRFFHFFEAIIGPLLNPRVLQYLNKNLCTYAAVILSSAFILSIMPIKSVISLEYNISDLG